MWPEYETILFENSESTFFFTLEEILELAQLNLWEPVTAHVT